MKDYSTIEKARKILHLPKKSSITSIKKAYYNLSKKYHPDKCKGNLSICKKKMQELTEAYKILMEYCESYPISFQKEEIEKIEPEFDYFKKFYSDFF